MLRQPFTEFRESNHARITLKAGDCRLKTLRQPFRQDLRRARQLDVGAATGIDGQTWRRSGTAVGDIRHAIAVAVRRGRQWIGNQTEKANAGRVWIDHGPLVAILRDRQRQGLPIDEWTQ